MGLISFFRNLGKSKRSQARRIFISFAIEDQEYRNYLVQQAKQTHSPFSFIDMSVKTNWPEHEWKEKCYQKIKRCHAVIVLLSNNTYHASGVRWEMRCANELGVPLVGMHIRKNDKSAVPVEIRRKNVMEWSWHNLEQLVKNLH